MEKEIVNILSDADPSELNYMLPKIGLGLLFYKVKDHAPINLHRTRLLNVLADNRISVRRVFVAPGGGGVGLIAWWGRDPGYIFERRWLVPGSIGGEDRG